MDGWSDEVTAGGVAKEETAEKSVRVAAVDQSDQQHSYGHSWVSSTSRVEMK